MLLFLALIGTRALGPARTAAMFSRAGKFVKRTPLAGRKLTVSRIATRVARRRSRALLPIECLEEAFAAWYLLNVKGHAAELKIGMKLTPVSGHAWVESEGETVGRIPGLEDFTVVGSFSAW